MKEEFKPFDAAEYLETPEDMAGIWTLAWRRTTATES